MRFFSPVFFASLIILPVWCLAAEKPMTDNQVRHLMIQGSISNFPGECPCPFSIDNKGKKCGDNSEYFKSPGDIYCYPEDISQSDVIKFRFENKINDSDHPWLIYN